MVKTFFRPLTALALASFVTLGISSASFAEGEFNRLDFVVDCSLGETGEDDHNITAYETLVVTLVNCAGLFLSDHDDTGNATMTGLGVLTDSNVEIPSGSVTLTFTGEADIDFDFSEEQSSTGPEFEDLDLDVRVATEVPNPASTLLATRSVSIELTASEVMIREEAIGTEGDDGSGDVYIGGNENCQVEPGLHVYSTLDFSITESGEYDFRAVEVSPIDEDMNWGVTKFPSSDPFLAVYENFDPANPEDGVIGCNDDNDDTGVAAIDDQWLLANDALLTETGYILDDQWPWFRTDMEPGDYSLVYMPFAAMGSEDFNAGRFSGEDPTWDPTAISVSYEMWGPEGGIVFGTEPAVSGDPGIFLTVTGGAGSLFEGRTVIYGSYAVAPNSPYKLTVQSIANPWRETRVLASGVVNGGGHLEATTRLPRMAADSYRIVFEGVAVDGQPLKLTNHVNVNAAGRFTSISAERLQPLLR